MLEAHDDLHVGQSPGDVPSTVQVLHGCPAERPASNAYVALTDFDSELSEAVDGVDRKRARRALLARSYRFAPGPVELSPAGSSDTTFALLVLYGSLIHRTEVATGQMIAFVSGGEVLMPFSPHPAAVRGRVSLTATEEVRLAALDQRFIRAAAVWPELMIIVQRRLCEQRDRLAVHGAICQLPRVEQRLMALMWHLADRSGKVTGEGIVVTRPLSHQTLADLVGARRPTVSLAVKALRDADHLRRRSDGTWLVPTGEGRSAGYEDLIGQLTDSAPFGAVAPEHGPEARHGVATTGAQR